MEHNTGAPQGAGQGGASKQEDQVAAELKNLAERAKAAVGGGGTEITNRVKASTAGFDFMKMFEGRVDRTTFIIFTVAAIIISIVLGWIPLIGQLLSLVLLVLGVGMGIRRLHDIDMSGWYVLVFLIPEVLSSWMTFSFMGGGMMGYGMMRAGMGLTSLLSLVSLGFLVYLCVKKGNPAANTYGPVPDPKRDFFKAVLNT
jgi:uncharacterized membrane protein YhaH (DUF805 family)